MDIEEIRETVAEILEVEPDVLTPETIFEDLPDYDSIKVLSIMVALDDLGISIDHTEASNLITFGDIIEIAKSNARK